MNRVYSSLKLHHPLWSEIWTKKVIKRHLEANDPRKGKNSSSKLKLQKKPGKMGNYGKKKGMYAQTQWDISQHFSKLSMHAVISGHQ